MINKTYADYAWEKTAALLAIDSPSGFTASVARWVKDAFEALGFPPPRVTLAAETAPRTPSAGTGTSHSRSGSSGSP